MILIFDNIILYIIKNTMSFYNEYHILSKISKGSYGTVYKAARNIDNKHFAVKYYVCNNGLIDPIILRELILLNKFKTSGISQAHKVFIERHTNTSIDIYVVMDLGAYTLSDLVKSDKVISEEDIEYCVLDIYKNLKYMKDIGYIHGDLKPANIIIMPDSSYKLIDLGFSKKWYRTMDFSTPPTAWYRSIELFEESSEKDISKIDIWSLGCIIYEMIARYPLFNGKTDIECMNNIHRNIGCLENKNCEEFNIFLKKSCKSNFEYEFLIGSINKIVKDRINLEKIPILISKFSKFINDKDIKTESISEFNKNSYIFDKEIDQQYLIELFKLDIKLNNLLREFKICTKSDNNIESYFIDIYYYKRILSETTIHSNLSNILIVLAVKLLSLYVINGSLIYISLQNIRYILNKYGCERSRKYILNIQDNICQEFKWDLDPVTIYEYSQYIPKNRRYLFLLIGVIISLDVSILNITEFEKSIITNIICNNLYNEIEKNEENNIHEQNDIILCEFDNIVKNEIKNLDKNVLLELYKHIEVFIISNFGLVKELNETTQNIIEIIDYYCQSHGLLQEWFDFKDHIIVSMQYTNSDIIDIFLDKN